MKLQLFALLLLPLAACHKEVPTAQITTDKSTAAPGETVMVQFTNSDAQSLQEVTMDAYLLKGPSLSSFHESQVYHSEDNQSMAHGTVMFVIPEVTTYAQKPETGDFYEFRLHCKLGRKKEMTKTCRVKIAS